MKDWLFVSTVILLMAGTGFFQFLGSGPSHHPAGEPAVTYVDPWDMALSPDGNDLYVVSRSADQVLRLDTRSGKVEVRVEVEEAPGGLALSPGEELLYVLSEHGFSVERLHIPSLERAGRYPVSPFPMDAHLADGGDSPRLFLSHHHMDTVTAIDPATGRVLASIAAGRGPGHFTVSPDGRLLLVSSWYSTRNDPRLPPVAELTGIDVHQSRVSFRLELEGAGILRRGAFTPDGRVALVGMQRSKNLIPNVGVFEGWTMTHGLVVLEQRAEDETPSGWKAHQILLDTLAEGNAEPYDVAISADGARAWVASMASNRVLVLDMERLMDVVHQTPEDELAYRLDLLDEFLVATIPVGP